MGAAAFRSDQCEGCDQRSLARGCCVSGGDHAGAVGRDGSDACGHAGARPAPSHQRPYDPTHLTPPPPLSTRGQHFSSSLLPTVALALSAVAHIYSCADLAALCAAGDGWDGGRGRRRDGDRAHAGALRRGRHCAQQGRSIVSRSTENGPCLSIFIPRSQEKCQPWPSSALPAHHVVRRGGVQAESDAVGRLQELGFGEEACLQVRARLIPPPHAPARPPRTPACTSAPTSTCGPPAPWPPSRSVSAGSVGIDA